MVAIPGDDVPVTTPVEHARRTWKNTAIFLLLGFLSFAITAIWIDPWSPGKVGEERDLPHEPEAPPPGPPPGSLMLMGVGR
jgi:hypothetical protein